MSNLASSPPAALASSAAARRFQGASLVHQALYAHAPSYLASGVAQWLGRRSLPGRLSSIYA